MVVTPTAVVSELVAERLASESTLASASTAVWNDPSLLANVPNAVFCVSSAFFWASNVLIGARSCSMTAERIWLKSILLKPLSVMGHPMAAFP